MKIRNVHISIMALKEGDNSAIVTSAKCALLYLLLRLPPINVNPFGGGRSAGKGRGFDA